MKKQTPNADRFIKHAPGIREYRDRPGVFVITKEVGSERKGKKTPKSETKYQPANESRALFIERLKVMRLELAEELRKDAPANIIKGTIRDAAERFINLLPEGSIQRRKRRSDLMPLVNALVDPKDRRSTRTFGDLPMKSLTREHLLQLMARWSLEPGQYAGTTLAAQTIRHRVIAIRQMYDTLNDDDTTYNPAAVSKKLKLPKLPTPEPRAIDLNDQLLIFSQMSDSRGDHSSKRGGSAKVNASKIRLEVFVNTGVPPASMKRWVPGDLDLDGKRAIQRDRLRGLHEPGPHVYLHPRKKGKGAPAQWLPLSAAGVVALQKFHAANLYGHFSTTSMNDVFKRAIKKAAKTFATAEERDAFLSRLPKNVRQYDLRHTYGTAVSFATQGDHETVAAMLQQTTTRMAKLYALAAFGVAKSRAAVNLTDLQQPVRTLTLVTKHA